MFAFTFAIIFTILNFLASPKWGASHLSHALKSAPVFGGPYILNNTNLLLMCQLIFIITMKPQSAHDSGIQHNHQSQWKKENHIPCGGICSTHPLLWVDICAEATAVLVLQDIFDNEHRRDKKYGKNPAKGNNHLKLNAYRFIRPPFHPNFFYILPDVAL